MNDYFTMVKENFQFKSSESNQNEGIWEKSILYYFTMVEEEIQFTSSETNQNEGFQV